MTELHQYVFRRNDSSPYRLTMRITVRQKEIAPNYCAVATQCATLVRRESISKKRECVPRLVLVSCPLEGKFPDEIRVFTKCPILNVNL